jgi:uncharacterized protein
MRYRGHLACAAVLVFAVATLSAKPPVTRPTSRPTTTPTTLPATTAPATSPATTMAAATLPASRPAAEYVKMSERELRRLSRSDPWAAGHLARRSYRDEFDRGPDSVTQFRLLSRAAEAGDVDARARVAYLRMTGIGVERDTQSGLEALRRSADVDNVLYAHLKLYAVYYWGYGAPKDVMRGVFHLGKAAELGDVDSMVNMARVTGEGVVLTPDAEISAKWWRLAAEAGNVPAMDRYARLLALGRGVGVDRVAAAEWYGKAAEKDSADAKATLGQMLLLGGDVPVDTGRALEMLKAAADSESAGAVRSAADTLGWGFFHGEANLPEDNDLALYYFRRAADAGRGSSMRGIAWMYEGGHGVSRDAALAFEWMLAGARAGDGRSMLEVAGYYEKGLGTERNPTKAAGWRRQAARSVESPKWDAVEH